MNVHLGAQHAFGQRLFGLRRQALKICGTNSTALRNQPVQKRSRNPIAFLYLGHTFLQKTECIVRRADIVPASAAGESNIAHRLTSALAQYHRR